MSDRLVTIDMGRKWGAVSLFEGGAGSPSNNVAWAEAYLRTKWHLDISSRFATTDDVPKIGALPLVWGNWVPIWHSVAGAEVEAYVLVKLHFIYLFILTYPTVWPQYTNVTDKQTGQTEQTDRTGQTTVR